MLRESRSWVFILTGFFALGITSAFLFDVYLLLYVVVVSSLSSACLLFVGTRYALYMVLVVAGFTLGYVRADLVKTDNAYHVLDTSVNSEVEFVAVVSEEVDQRDYNSRVTLHIPQHDTKILARVPFYPEYRYGDKLLVRGVLNVPEAFEGDTGRVFDYPNYLLKDGVRYIMNYPELGKIGERAGHPVKSTLLRFKQSLLDQMGQIFLNLMHLFSVGCWWVLSHRWVKNS